MSRSSISQTPCSARNTTKEIESCGEKCANLCRVYKLIMVSRVPGYGHLEYLVLELLFDLITLLNEFVELLILLDGNLGLSWGNLLSNGINLVVK